MSPEQFIQERLYLLGVTRKTTTWYGCSFKAFAGALDSKAAVNQRIVELRNRNVSLDLAKRLKELGVKQESFFKWTDRGGYDTKLEVSELVAWHEGASAFTVAELGEMLPWQSTSWKGSDNEETGNEQWACKTSRGQSPITSYQFWAETEADARAEMLIYLLENKLYNAN